MDKFCSRNNESKSILSSTRYEKQLLMTSSSQLVNRKQPRNRFYNRYYVSCTQPNERSLIWLLIVIYSCTLHFVIVMVKAEEDDNNKNNDAVSMDDYFVDDIFVEQNDDMNDKTNEAWEQPATNGINIENWRKGIIYCILATIVGAASKLAIRKSWLLAANYNNVTLDDNCTNTSTIATFVSMEEPTPYTQQQQLDNYQKYQEERPSSTSGILAKVYNSRDNNNGDGDDFEYQKYNPSRLNAIIMDASTKASLDRPYLTHTNNNNNDDSNNNNNNGGGGSFNCCLLWKVRWYRILRLLGMIGVGIINPILCVIAMKYVSPSVGAPFAGLTMVWILLFSGPLLKEYPSQQQWLACSLIIYGEMLIAIFGDHTNGQYNVALGSDTNGSSSSTTGSTSSSSSTNDNSSSSSGMNAYIPYYYGSSKEDNTERIIESNLSLLETVYESYFNPSFLLYFVGILIWISFVLYWIFYPKFNGISDAEFISYHNHKVVRMFGWWKVPIVSLRRFCWGVAGGSVAGNLNFLKDSLIMNDTVETIRTQLQYHYYYNSNYDEGEKHTTLNDVIPTHIQRFRIIMYILTFCTAFLGLFLLVKCMKRYNAPYSSTMFVGSYVLVASLMSFVHYDTLQHLGRYKEDGGNNNLGYIFYPMGLVILLGGVFLLMMEDDEHATKHDNNNNLIDTNNDPQTTTNNDAPQTEATTATDNTTTSSLTTPTVITTTTRNVKAKDPIAAKYEVV